MSDSTQITDVTREYYDSSDADTFYATIWGGEDIHIGTYLGPDDDIFGASRRTVEFMAGMLQTLTKDSTVLDMGSGYGGSARLLVKRFDCRKAECLNLSVAQNQRNRKLCEAQGLTTQVSVTDGDFENLPYGNEEFDIVWSQDAFLHSGKRRRVVEEAVRVLKPGGELIFTDPMQSDTATPEQLKPIYDRIHLESMGSFSFYRKVAGELGLEVLNIVDLTHQMRNHYANVRAELVSREAEIAEKVSTTYIENMKKGLSHWVEGAEKGYLNWGIMHFRKK